MREYVWLECTTCGDRNYRTQKETRGAERLELKSIAGASGSTRHTRNRGRSEGGDRIGLRRPTVGGEPVPVARLCWLTAGRTVRTVGSRARTTVGQGVLANERSSIGRAPVSKTGGWGFDSLRSCSPAAG